MSEPVFDEDELTIISRLLDIDKETLREGIKFPTYEVREPFLQAVAIVRAYYAMPLGLRVAAFKTDVAARLEILTDHVAEWTRNRGLVLVDSLESKAMSPEPPKPANHARRGKIKTKP